VSAGVHRYVSGSCGPGGTAAGGSWIVMMCPASGVLRLGWGFTTLSAAHREMHSRPQPQEQDAWSFDHLVGPLKERRRDRQPQRQGAEERSLLQLHSFILFC